MDKEQKKRMANRTIVESHDEGEDTEYTVQVSGDRAELHQQYEAPWDGEDGNRDVQHEVFVMDKDTLKKLIKAAEWCIEKSEAFEASHPIGGDD